MFYLKKFFFVLGKFPVRSGFFLLLTVLLTLVVQQEAFFSKMIKGRLTDSEMGSTLWVLVEGDEGSDVALKRLIRHPGIKKVLVRRGEQVKDNLLTELRPTDFQLPQSILEKKYWGFKVFLAVNADRRTETEIIGQIKNLFGDERTSFGPIKRADDPQFLKMGKVYSFIREWGYTIAVLFIFSFWCFFFYLVSVPIAEVGALIEGYQQRSMVRFRMAFYGLLSIDVAMGLLTLKLGPPSLVSMVVLALIFLLFSTLTTKLKNAYE